MNTFTVRTVIATAVAGLALATLSIPASASARVASSPISVAADIDEDVVAAQKCPAGAEFLAADFAEHDSGVQASLFVYEVENTPETEIQEDLNITDDQLCTFAVISTDEDDATLDGNYSLTATGAESASGAVTGTGISTEARVTPAGVLTSTAVSAAGQQTVVERDRASKGEKKRAKKKYDAAKKKATKSYKKSGKTKKAKKARNKAIAKAKKAYTKAIATRTTISKDRYVVNVGLEIPADEQ
jgi:hypothetical protein